HPDLEGCQWRLQRTREQAQTTLSGPLEQLATDLANTSLNAWGQLYDQVTGRMSFTLDEPGEAGETRQVPLALKRSLLASPNAATRRSVLVRSNAEFERLQEVFGAAINAIAGHRLTMQRWRGQSHFLDDTLFTSDMGRDTLDAMFAAIDARLELPRRYLARKAAILGKERLGFQDLNSPLPFEGEHSGVTWDEARARIERAFGKAYPALGDFARMAFEQRWIDAKPGPNRRAGGFCTGTQVLGQSRIFVTYNNTLGDVQTLAHELGHAFHSWVMRDMRLWANMYPMTLAETASTFAEAILTDALLNDDRLQAADRLKLLNTCLERAEGFMLNVPMRFRFEYNLYTERQHGMVSVTRIKELMLEAQRYYYGDSLDDQELDPFFWASKLHFFITSVSFYNYPYTFGYLFSQGAMAEARRQGSAFFPRYEALLRLTGSASAETIAQETLGVDLTQPDFWLASIDQVERELDHFEALADTLFGR
ncbi:MAG: M3 family oligoendopeptidase, partial [Myxococcota bacterium]